MIVFMHERPVFRFGLRHVFVIFTLIAVSLALFVNFGPLSTLVASLSATAITAIAFRYFTGWHSFSARKKWIACVFTTICSLIVVGFASGLWMQPQVRSNRLTTIYNAPSKNCDLTISIFRSKVLLVTVSGTVESKEVIEEIRSDMLRRFNNDPRLMIRWDIVTFHGAILNGEDSELFPAEDRARFPT